MDADFHMETIFTKYIKPSIYNNNIMYVCVFKKITTYQKINSCSVYETLNSLTFHI